LLGSLRVPAEQSEIDFKMAARERVRPQVGRLLKCSERAKKKKGSERKGKPRRKIKRSFSRQDWEKLALDRRAPQPSGGTDRVGGQGGGGEKS